MFSRKHQKQLDRVLAYQQVFNTEDGKKVLLDLMKQHYILSTCFDKCSLTMALREGEKNAVLRILSILQIDASNLSEKMKEMQIEEDKYKE